MGWRSVNLHTHISLVNRYVYVEVPKAGCGTMKATLGGLEAARMGPAMVGRVQENPHDRMAATPFVKPFQLPADLLEHVLTEENLARTFGMPLVVSTVDGRWTARRETRHRGD